DEKHRCAAEGSHRQRARARACGRRTRPPLDRRVGHPSRFSAAAIARAKLTIRGPHREAIESSIRTIEYVFTALSPLHPGRAATVAGVCPQHVVSARTSRSGSAETTYSAERCG